MRRFWSLATLVLLLVGLLLLQRHRFERVPNAPTMDLADVRKMLPALPTGAEWTDDSSLRLMANRDHPPVRLLTGLPYPSPVDGLHIRFNMVAQDLSKGDEMWEDGRLLIQWVSPQDSRAREIDPIGSVRENKVIEESTLIAKPAKSPSVPILRIENLGKSGFVEFSILEMTPVRETTVWKVGKWLLLGSWFVWLSCVLATGSKQSLWRPCLASGIWVVMVVLLAFPGPWKTIRPMIVSFNLGGFTQVVPNQESPDAGAKNVHLSDQGSDSIDKLSPVGKIESSENWLLRVKRVLKNQRILLHILLLFLPTMTLAILLGAKRAFFLGVSLAIAIELTQTAFGYGFDWVDVQDFISDFSGIALALWLYTKWKRRRTKQASSERRLVS